MIRILALAFWLLPLAARAQDSALLVADTLVVTAEERLVATGNVQAFYEGTTLSAAQVTYDRATDRLVVIGPILIRDPDGTVVTAEQAELDARLNDGLLRGARLVLDRQLQLAANRIDRVDGLTALTGAAATSCQVCPGRTPLWEIRAAQVIRDEAAEQLYFEDARFLVRGVPILWIPRLRLPDPDNERATGLLIPRLRASDRLGVGIELPYFIELGQSRDLTLTPYLSSETLTLEARYRQAFLNGDLQIEGAVSRDDLTEDETRGVLQAQGAFDLGDRLDLAFSITAVSDEAYLLDYGYGDQDRLESTLRLVRVGETTLFEGDLTHFQSLRDDETAGALPPVLAALSWEKRRDARGGTLTFGASADGFVRTAEGQGASARDLTRLGGFAGWRREEVLGPGLLVETQARGALDFYRVSDDPAYPEERLRAATATGVTLRWPLVRRGPQGRSDLLEPVASLGWTGSLGGTPPNEDSRLVEFDEANLLALSRLPGEDALEEGGRLSLGLSWTRQGTGFVSNLAFGRVLRSKPSDLSEASGLAGERSDWLVAGQLDLRGGFSLDARTLLGGDLRDVEIGKSEARVDWSNRAVSLSAGYLFLPADPAEDRTERAAEWTVDADWRPSERWSLGVETRYDAARRTPARLGLEVGWRNECVEVDVSLARRYTSTDDEGPSTELGLSVNLNGFSAGGEPRVAPSACRR